MQYKFHAFGHPSILATHKTTLEFTRDEEVSLRGDCIIGVKAGFDLNSIKNFIENLKNKKITIKIQSSDKKIKDTLMAEINTDFSSNKELVIRKTDFVSGRTLGIRSNKAAFELKKSLIDYLKERN